MGASPIDLLMILLVSGRQAADLMARLRRRGFYFTEIDSWGEVLHDPTICLLVGLNSSRSTALLNLVKRCCKPQNEYVPARFNALPDSFQVPMIEARVGGATVYTLQVERFLQI